MMRNLIGRLKASTSGASTAELALAFPMLIIMLLPAIDYGMAFALQQRMTAAATQAVQRATAENRVMSSYAYLDADTAVSYPGAGAGDVSTTITNWLECNGVRAASAGGLCPGGQRYARYVTATVRTTYTPMFKVPGVFGEPMPIRGQASVRVQ